MNKSIQQFKLNPVINRILLCLMVVGLVVFIIGLFVEPKRVWANFLISEFYLLSLGVGAGLFIASMYVTNAGWGTAIRRVPEAITSILPVAGIGALLLYWGIHSLYEWSHYSVVVEDPILSEKQPWLNEIFFMIRIIIYFSTWIWITSKLLITQRSRIVIIILNILIIMYVIQLSFLSWELLPSHLHL